VWQALDSGASGAPVGWRNQDSGRYGTVVPGPAYQRNAMTCRQYTHTIYIEAARRSRAGRPAAIPTAPGRRSAERARRAML